MNPYLVQAIGFVGVALFIISYQIKSNRALGLTINITRNILLLKSKDWPWARSRTTLFVLLAALTVMTVFTWA